MPGDIGERPVLCPLPDMFGHMRRNNPVAVGATRIQPLFDQTGLLQSRKRVSDHSEGQSKPGGDFGWRLVFGQRGKDQVLDW